MDIEIFIAKYRQLTPQSTRNRMEIIFMILKINNNEIKLRSHYYEIFDKFPKLVENSKFFLQSSVLLIFDTFANIVAYSIKHRHFRINKSLDSGHWLGPLRYWATFDDILNNKNTPVFIDYVIYTNIFGCFWCMKTLVSRWFGQLVSQEN